MHSTVEEIMSRDVCTASDEQTAQEAAQLMSDKDIGSVIVTKSGNGAINGIVTDRDIAVRAIAQGAGPESCKLGEIASKELLTLAPKDTIDSAIEKMRSAHIRRLPVVEDEKPVGMVALGDLAAERDPSSVLGEISQAPANH